MVHSHKETEGMSEGRKGGDGRPLPQGNEDGFFQVASGTEEL